MSWQQLRLTCESGDLQRVEDLLCDLGALSISLGDAGDEPIYEPLPGESPVWHETVVSATFGEDADAEEIEQRLKAQLPAGIALSVTRDSLQDRDWQQAYRQHFKPMQCAPSLWIVPSWLNPPDPEATNLRLDPGLAFGTGSHPTTALCLAALAEHNLQDLELIDYGCGSGILAIAGILLGANKVLAVDIDEQALTACRANMAMNSIAPGRITVGLPQAADNAVVDLLMANILAGPLVELAARLSGMVKPGGKILLSGILNSQVNEIQSAYEQYFDLEPVQLREEWICIGGRRHSG